MNFQAGPGQSPGQQQQQSLAAPVAPGSQAGGSPQPQFGLSNSAAIRAEIGRFESVHPNIYAIYDLIERVEDLALQSQIREHVISIEGEPVACTRAGAGGLQLALGSFRHQDAGWGGTGGRRPGSSFLPTHPTPTQAPPPTSELPLGECGGSSPRPLQQKMEPLVGARRGGGFLALPRRGVPAMRPLLPPFQPPRAILQ